MMAGKDNEDGTGAFSENRGETAAKWDIEEWCPLTGVLKRSFLLLFGN